MIYGLRWTFCFFWDATDHLGSIHGDAYRVGYTEKWLELALAPNETLAISARERINSCYEPGRGTSDSRGVFKGETDKRAAVLACSLMDHSCIRSFMRSYSGARKLSLRVPHDSLE